MIVHPPYEFNWTADNFGTTYSEAGFGVNSPGHANANTKGANTNMLNGIAEDAYGIAICFCNGNTSTAARRNFVDLLVDPAAGVGNAGSSWTVKINNLYVNSASLVMGGYWYYFPLFIKQGTAIGTANQSTTASTSALRVGIKVFGKPSRPECCRVGNVVTTIGASVPTTVGTSITLGAQAKSAYSVVLGYPSGSDHWWWQVGAAMTDTARADEAYLLDIAWSPDDGTTFEEIIANCVMTDTNLEQSGKAAIGDKLPIRMVPAGEGIYARATATVTAETGFSMVAYGLF